MDRRSFIAGAAKASIGMAASGALCALGMGSAFAASNVRSNARSALAVNQDILDTFWTRPRDLWLRRQATGEEARVIYGVNGRLVRNGYVQACQLLRDVQAGEAVQMYVGLLDALYAMQTWLRVYGVETPIDILSGYRSPETNANTEGAARNSMHMYGRAADIRIPGLSTRYVSELADRLSEGGIGFYPSKKFVHVDIGRERSWTG